LPVAAAQEGGEGRTLGSSSSLRQRSCAWRRGRCPLPLGGAPEGSWLEQLDCELGVGGIKDCGRGRCPMSPGWAAWNGVSGRRKLVVAWVRGTVECCCRSGDPTSVSPQIHPASVGVLAVRNGKNMQIRINNTRTGILVSCGSASMLIASFPRDTNRPAGRCDSVPPMISKRNVRSVNPSGYMLLAESSRSAEATSRGINYMGSL
jgi:hypothetical protein